MIFNRLDQVAKTQDDNSVYFNSKNSHLSAIIEKTKRVFQDCQIFLFNLLKSIHNNFQAVLNKLHDRLPSFKFEQIENPNSSTTEKIKKVFEDFTKFMNIVKNCQDQDQWKHLNDSINRLPDLQKNRKLLAHALNQGDWKNPIFQKIDASYYGLGALREGLITVEQLSTLLIYWFLQKNHPDTEIKVINLFEKGEINPRAREIIIQTLKVAIIPDELKTQILKDEEIIYLNEKQIQSFFDKIKTKPLSEQYFFVIPDFFPIPKNYSGLLETATITQEINQSTGINVFCRFSENGKLLKMIPSLSMMQSYLDSKYSAPIKIHPVINIPSAQEIEENGLTHERYCSLPCKDESLPKTADEFEAPSSEFFDHDFYHAQLASTIPEAHQCAFIAFGRFIKSLEKEQKFNYLNDLLRIFYERLIDMEHVRYRKIDSKASSNDLSICFWKSISDSYLSAIARLAFIGLKTMRTKNIEKNQQTLNLIAKNLKTDASNKMQTNGLFPVIFNFFCSNDWIEIEKQSGITHDGITDAIDQLEDEMKNSQDLQIQNSFQTKKQLMQYKQENFLIQYAKFYKLCKQS
jgi:hypothetical protein